MAKFRTLWRGELPLGEAFWIWGVLGGLLVNISTSVAFLVLITADRPWSALIIGYAFSLPYNVVAVVGIWRSAERHNGPRYQAELACGAAVILMTVLSLT